jgi:hypothetical protein
MFFSLNADFFFRANDAGLLALYQAVHLNRHFVGIIAQSLADVNVS